MAEERNDSAGGGRLDPLVTLRVLDVTGGLPAARICGSILADHGADVTVLAGGQWQESSSPAPTVFARNVRYVLAEPGENAALKVQLDWADVIIGAAGKESQLRDYLDQRTDLIVCTISGFGAASSRAGLAIEQILVDAYSGASAAQTGWQPGPSRIALPVLSVLSGLLAAQGILAALIRQQRTGESGGHVETSLLAAASLMAAPVSDKLGQLAPEPTTFPARGAAPLYALYECEDGGWIQLGCLHGGFVDAAIEALDISEEVAILRRMEGFGDGVAISDPDISTPFFGSVARAMIRRPATEWLKVFDDADIPAAKVCQPGEYASDALGFGARMTVFTDQCGRQLTRPAEYIRYDWHDGASGAAQARRFDTLLDVPRSGDGPLTGVLVAEFGNLIAGPMAGRCLAELGATVIKVEPPTGEIFRQQQRSEFFPLNSGKLSLAVDLKVGGAKIAVRRLLDQVDAVICNYRPGVLNRLGLGYEAIRTENPSIVMCQISAFGTDGPLAHRPGGDPLAAALTGISRLQGSGGDPVYLYGAPVDYTSALLATVGVLVGLYERGRTGNGCCLDTSLLDAAALIVGDGYLQEPTASARSEIGNQYQQDVDSGLYPTASGWLAIVINNDMERRQLCSLLGSEDSFTPALSTKSAAEWCAILQAVGLACQVVNEEKLAIDDSELLANSLVADFSTDAGPRSSIARWVKVSGVDRGCSTGAPPLGAHSSAILRGLGYQSEEISQLISVNDATVRN